MTVVLITGNLINQLKCLITTALLSAEHKGSRFDEFQKEMRVETNSQHFSPETQGVRGALGKVWGPQKPEVGALERGLLAGAGTEQPSETCGIKASLGPDFAQKPGLP